MTRKICILGNSHIAAYIVAAREFPARWPELQIDAFGAQGNHLNRYRVVEGRFVSQHEPTRARLRELVGRDSFALAEYDALVVTGLRFSFLTAAHVFRELSTLAMPSVQSHEQALEQDRPLASGAMIRAYVSELLAQTAGFRLATRLRAASEVPVFMASQPRPAVSSRDTGGPYGLLRSLCEQGDGTYVSALNRSVSHALCAEAGITYLPQPDDTISCGVFTNDAFMRGSVRLARRDNLAHGQDDVLHANADYARLVIDMLARKMNFPIHADE